MQERDDSDFCIEIDFNRGSGSPSRVFRTMSDLIDAFQETDRNLIRAIDSELRPVLLLEDVESGSVRAWLKQELEKLDDDALKSGDYKKVLGHYLVRAKYSIIRFLEKKTDITDAKELDDLEVELNKLAEDTNVKMIPAYQPVAREKLVRSIEKINDSLAPLNDDDRAIFIIDERTTVEFNLTLNIAPETIEQLVTAETLSSVSTMILKVKKPDFLGNSQWEFRWNNRIILANIGVADWLKDYQDGYIKISPGDAIRADVLTQVQYGFDGEVVSTHYTIVKVADVIPREFILQTRLRGFESQTDDGNERQLTEGKDECE